MADPIIRRAVEEDIADIRTLTIRAYTKWVEITPRPPRPMTADYNQAFADHRHHTVEQIRSSKRFREIAHHPALTGSRLVTGAPLRGQHDNGYSCQARSTCNRLRDLPPAEFRHAHIQDHQPIRHSGLRRATQLKQGLLATRDLGRGNAPSRQRFPHNQAVGRIVVHDQGPQARQLLPLRRRDRRRRLNMHSKLGREAERTPSAQFAVHPHLAAHPLNQSSGNRQPEPGAAVRPGR